MFAVQSRPKWLIPILTTILAVTGMKQPALGQCVPFHDSLDNLTTVNSNNGIVIGSVTFAPAVNGPGAVFNSSGSLIYTNALFNAPSGAVSLWFRKNSPDDSGGIMQIGTIGQPNSLGLFYVGQTDLFLEARNNAGTGTSIPVPGVLSQTDWTHIAAVWNNTGSDITLWIFINGLFFGSSSLNGAFQQTGSHLQLGTTGFYGLGEGEMDEVRFFDWAALDDEIYAEYVFSSNRFQKQPTGKTVSTGPVQIIGGDLFVEGQRFIVKGVGYQPTPVGSPNSSAVINFIYTDPGIIQRDMAMLRGMNVNAIRTWTQPPDTTLLDACYNGGVDPIYVIVGFWVPQNPGINYADPGTIAAIQSDFSALVNQFKDHPAVLAWGIGNENNLVYGGNLTDWYTLANSLADIAYGIEGTSYHPSLIVNGGMRQFGNVDLMSDDASLGSVDMWGHNAYPGEDFHCYFDYYGRLSAKPLVLTEYGIDAYDNQSGVEYQAVQATFVVQQWRQIAAVDGGTVMAYSDEWWKAGNPSTHDLGGYATRTHPDGFSNEEWWGMVSVEDAGNAPDIVHPRAVYDALAVEYARLLGDLNCDGLINSEDIAPFVLSLLDAASYQSQYPDCDIFNADFDGNSILDTEDIITFVQILLIG
ncbi:MAG: LamG-like jellyroll fold domain-containing protein [Phycisphaerae bacterium]